MMDDTANNPTDVFLDSSDDLARQARHGGRRRRPERIRVGDRSLGEKLILLI